MNEIRSLIWDDWNVPHIARHDVTPEEVEAACKANPMPYRESYKNRVMFLGETPAGRVIAIVLGPVPNAQPGTWYPFSARTAHRTERRGYQQWKGDQAS